MLYIIAKLRKNGSGRILKWKKEYELFLNLFLIVSKSGTGAAGFAAGAARGSGALSSSGT